MGPVGKKYRAKHLLTWTGENVSSVQIQNNRDYYKVTAVRKSLSLTYVLTCSNGLGLWDKCVIIQVQGHSCELKGVDRSVQEVKQIDSSGNTEIKLGKIRTDSISKCDKSQHLHYNSVCNSSDPIKIKLMNWWQISFLLQFTWILNNEQPLSLFSLLLQHTYWTDWHS